MRNSLVALKKVTWAYQQAAPIPLFIGIDQEGGKVNRLKDKYGFPRSITAQAMVRPIRWTTCVSMPKQQPLRWPAWA